jgi:hypothetical protein
VVAEVGDHWSMRWFVNKRATSWLGSGEFLALSLAVLSFSSGGDCVVPAN